MQGYFMSDEAEKAATGNLVETFTAANSACAKLENEMSSLGKELEGLAQALKYPKNHRFEISSGDIRVWEDVSGPPFVRRGRLTSQQYTFQTLSDLVASYTRARKDKEESAARLKTIGIPIAE
jgi:hypothetical protein